MNVTPRAAETGTLPAEDPPAVAGLPSGKLRSWYPGHDSVVLACLRFYRL
jgi:hypothetical protein